MADAKKCDRCGGFFDPWSVRGEMVRFSNPVYRERIDLIENTISHRFLDKPDALVDLCPKCTTLFTNFMNNMDIGEER